MIACRMILMNYHERNTHRISGSGRSSAFSKCQESASVLRPRSSWWTLNPTPSRSRGRVIHREGLLGMYCFLLTALLVMPLSAGGNANQTEEFIASTGDLQAKGNATSDGDGLVVVPVHPLLPFVEMDSKMSYAMAILAGGELQVEQLGEVYGNLHTNSNLYLAAETLVEGNVSASTGPLSVRCGRKGM